jgi:hypothetical protein
MYVALRSDSVIPESQEGLKLRDLIDWWVSEGLRPESQEGLKPKIGDPGLGAVQSLPRISRRVET